MKIRTTEDRIKLTEEIKVELGIDIEKYRAEEIAETVYELLSFPQYILSYTIRPIVLSIIFFVIGFYVLNLVNIEYLIYGVIGFALLLATGMLIGLIFLTNKIKGDTSSVLTYSIEIFSDIIEDLKLSKKNLAPERKRYQYNLLFQGIIHNITIPVFTETIADKVPIIGGLLKSIIFKTLSSLANIFNVDKPDSELEVELNKTGEKSILNEQVSFLEKANLTIGKSLNSVFRIAQFPIKFLLGVVSLILVIFIYLIN